MLKKIGLLLALVFTISSYAQIEDVTFDSIQYQKRGSVILAKDTLFYLYDNLNGISARERAALVNQRLQNIVESPAFSADSILVEDRTSNTARSNE